MFIKGGRDDIRTEADGESEEEEELSELFDKLLEARGGSGGLFCCIKEGDERVIV